MNYTIWIATLNGYNHSRAFDECSLSLRDALIELGNECIITNNFNEIPNKVIVLGAHMLRYLPSVELPKNAILFNSEQLGSRNESPFLDDEYLKLLKKFDVWDYSASNIEYMKANGINAKLCELGYMPILETIPKVEEDIDVLFIGSLNTRRQKILNDLLSLGIRAVAAFNIYGVDKDRLVSRAKIILNIHYYEAKIFEIFRCSYMMANKKCVVSEIGLDAKLESKYSDGIVFCGYDDLVATVGKLLKDDRERKRVANRGYEIFSSFKQTEFLKPLI